jgi:hypothetical protein
MITDRQGNRLSGATPAAADALDDAVEAFSLYRGDPIAAVDRAIAAAPDFALAQIFKAYLLVLSTEPEAIAAAAGILRDLQNLDLDDREASHRSALESLVAGQWTAAAERLDRHNADHPRDLIGVQAGHLTDFSRAHSRN